MIRRHILSVRPCGLLLLKIQVIRPPNTLRLWQNLLRVTRLSLLKHLIFSFTHYRTASTQHWKCWEIWSSYLYLSPLTLHPHDPQTTPRLKYWAQWSPNDNCFEMFKNIRESSSTFHSPSRGDCSIFLCVISKSFAFSCGKKEWPAGTRENYRFRHCNFAT